MPPAWTTYLLRYGELGIKSRSVRRRFEQQLVRNLEAHFERAKASCVIEREWGRIFLDSPDPEVARHAITHTFGLVSGSPTDVLKADLETLAAHVRTLAPDHVQPGRSFAIRARRTGTHAYSSQDIGVRCGDAVLRAVPEATVDLDDPDVEIFVEVRSGDAYVFTEVLEAPGGLPTGSQGTMVVPFLGPRSPACAWLVMRRGASVHALVPEGCADLVATLEPWAPGLTYTVLAGTHTREGLLAASQHLAEQVQANALALDDHETRALTPVDLGVPVLRPLAGLPGRRWPRGAYAVSKKAAKLLSGTCVDEDEGASPEGSLDALASAQRHVL